jgi:hypothetical protein
MAKAIYLITAALLVMQSFTAVIGEPSDLTYHLVIKPYPSLLKSVPGFEERTWKRKVASGEIPRWVEERRYVLLGSGSAELRTQPWEWFYAAFWLITLSCVVASAVLILRSVIGRIRQHVATS